MRKKLLISAFFLASWTLAGQALALDPGDLITLPDDGNAATTADEAVYYYAGDGKRYVFPNAKTYFTWYADFSKVKTVDAAALADIPVGGNVTYRPGTRLVKITTDPKVYAVEPDGRLRPIASEAVAENLYGSNWNARVDDLPDAFFTDYAAGAPLETPVYPDGSVLLRGSDNAVFYIENGATRRITSSEIRNTLRIRTEFIVLVSDLSAYPDGPNLSFAEPHLYDTAQLGAAPDTADRERFGAASASLRPDDALVGGVSDADVFRFELLAASSGANHVSSLAFQGYVDEQEGGQTVWSPGSDNDDGTPRYVRDHVPSVSLYDAAGTRIAGPADVSATGQVVFDEMALTLTSGSAAVFSLRGDLREGVATGQVPDRVAFDLVAASVADDAGDNIPQSTLAPNGGANPAHFITIAEQGSVALTWKGRTGFAVAGRREKIGTLTAGTARDAYDLTTLTIRSAGLLESVAELELVSGGESVSAAYPGATATFDGLPFTLARNAETTVEVWAVLKPSSQAEHDERLRFEMRTDDDMSFTSQATGEIFDEIDVRDDTHFTLTSTASDLFVRFTEVAFLTSSETPGGTVARGRTVPVLRFRVRAAPEGAVRVKRLTFELEPGDAGSPGPDNDALERWADLNGDVQDDNDVGELWRVNAAGAKLSLIGEGDDAGHARIRYSIVKDGEKDDTPQGLDSGPNDHGLLEYVFDRGRELTVPAGETRDYLFELATREFALLAHDLKISILGGFDFAWTDVEAAAPDYHTGVIIPGLPLESPVMTVER